MRKREETNPKANEEWRKHQRKTAWIFVRMNRRTQRGFSLLFRCFFLLTAAISFILIGQLYKCADDTYTKNYDHSIFYQKNDSRLSVKRRDGKELTEDDIKKMQSVKYVEQVDSQDYAADVNYYIEEGRDFVYHYNTIKEDQQENEEWSFDDWESAPRSTLTAEKIPDFKKKDKFMKSSTCITMSNLSQGRLPEKRNEIVLYPDKKTKLGDEKTLYFTAENIWADEYYLGKMKVVGFLKEKTSQIYFSTDFCHMLTAYAERDMVNMNYYYDGTERLYMGEDWFVLIIGEDLPKNSVEENQEISYARVSRNYIPNLEAWTRTGMLINGPVEKVVPGINQIYITLNSLKKNTPTYLKELDGLPIPITVLGVDEKGDKKKTNKNFNNHSGRFLEVSEEVFNQFFPRQSCQASVYIKNYTKTDEVIKNLDKLGYHGISTFRAASSGYNQKKVMERLIFICIALGILLLLFVAEVLILSALMKLRIRDFSVLKSLGMHFSTIRRISLYEMTGYCVESLLFTVLAMILLYVAGLPFIQSTLIYFGFMASAAYICYNITLELVSVHTFNRLLAGRMAINNYK